MGASQFTSQSYDYVTGQYVFTVEQGTQFYLSYNTNTYPTPSASDMELYKNGQHLQRARGGTITLQGNYMNIPAVDQVNGGNYTITNSEGGQLSFRLIVKGKCTLHWHAERRANFGRSL